MATRCRCSPPRAARPAPRRYSRSAPTTRRPKAKTRSSSSRTPCSSTARRRRPEVLLRETWDEVITRRIFGQDHPPRWLLVLSFSRVLLIERGKWTHNRLLRFDLDEILGRREDATLKAAGALLHRDCLLPPDGRSLLDSLDENSHKHAFAVSEDLKYALRESIELIGNEAIRYLREVLKDKVYDRPDDALAGQLGRECLRYMYRLLFLFYIEARPDLGYAPMDSETYLKGYSLEHLRDLELVRLTSEESLDGYYLHHAVQTLFGLIRDGFDGSQRGGAADLLAAEPGTHLHHGFRIRALDSALFREGSTPLLDRVKLRNRVLQQVIRLMSLTRPAKGRRGRRGRISYAQLGINQLGAVYEALLSYRGFFAEEDLYEVKKAGEPDDPLKSAWFVPARDLDDYTDEERVYDKDDEGLRKLRVHPRGRFIYRLAGRDRQKTASYYTPESLTRCVVKYALRELISDDMLADRILDLTVCEPAMGSAAFLNEAVNQLAEKYLERKQRELGRRIPHAEYANELQQVKHYIADRNVYGVDLNPVARELAEVSLWLNCIHQRRACPLVRLSARLRQLAGRRATTGVPSRRARRAPQERVVVQPRPRARSTPQPRRRHSHRRRDETNPAALRRHGLSLSAARPRYGRLRRQGGPGDGTGQLPAHHCLAQALLRTVRCRRGRPSSRRSPTAWTNCGRCTLSSSPATAAPPRTHCGCGAAPTAIPAAPPTLGRTASAPRASSATTRGAPAPAAA